MTKPMWVQGAPTPWKDGWDRVEVKESETLLACPKCAALVRNREESVTQHSRWHVLGG